MYLRPSLISVLEDLIMKTDIQAMLDFAGDLTRMKVRAMELGLVETCHAMEPATQKVGWEIADVLAGKHPMHRGFSASAEIVKQARGLSDES